MSLFDELKRRNVFRIAGLYIVGSWLIVQVATTVLPLFDALAWLPRIIVIVLAIGFIPALIFAWAFELTPEGLKREKDVEAAESITHVTGSRLNRIIIVVLALALGYFAFDKFVLSTAREQSLAEVARKEGRTEALVNSFGDKSIAVLPFEDLSPGKDQGYFSDGIAEELLNLLAKIPELRVTSRSSAFAFRGQDLDMHAIATRLNVAHVLEGSVRKSGNRVRVTAQLIDADADTQVWSETYDRMLDDIFAVQDEISAAVVEQLKIALLGEKRQAQRVDAQAYDFFLQARQQARLHSAEGYQQAVTLYQQSLKIDDAYPPAWSGLAYVYRRQANNGMRPLEEGYALAAKALKKALALNPHYAPALAELGRIALDHDGDLAAAAKYLEQALSLEPANSDILGYSAIFADSLGRLDQGISINQYALQRDPLNPTLHNSLGIEYRNNGQLDRAIDSFRTALSLSPGDISVHYHIGEALLLKGEPEAALTEIQNEPFEAWRMIGLPMAYYSLKRKRESDEALAALVTKYSESWPYNIAYVLAWRGEKDRAFEFLEKARVVRDPGLSDLAMDKLFANIRGNARWNPFARKIGKAPEQLDAIKFDVKLPAT